MRATGYAICFSCSARSSETRWGLNACQWIRLEPKSAVVTVMLQECIRHVYLATKRNCWVGER